jgi:GPI ethanolamine phosphate transferase 3 subunit O
LTDIFFRHVFFLFSSLIIYPTSVSWHDMISKGLGLLIWVFFLHLTGIYLFTRGFLLTRLSLSEINNCASSPCSSSPTHTRAVFLIIDALRFDFISPSPPNPPSPFHHHVLTLPQQLTAARPENSFIFHTYADPPTTTLQRIKGLTTGSLPTFVDIGSSFGGSSIEEDSIVRQLTSAGKQVSTSFDLIASNMFVNSGSKVAFMGDDTWVTVFPDSFHQNMSFPYDSFNVEDLHTVDEGVIRHIFPLLEDKNKPFDYLIGHFLGVDHVGHRVGPDHPTMKTKLEQMNQVLTRVVDLLDEDTLLVVIGDHGMDRTGDHGGDGELETSAGTWIYSKGPALSNQSISIPSSLLHNVTFPGSSISSRSIQQIDLVPSLSLLLGLPIPFNSLGTVIPELFWRDHKGSEFSRALEINAAQVRTYLDTYRASPSGGELDDSWSDLQASWAATEFVPDGVSRLFALHNYTRLALSVCRSLWAQFNIIPMVSGLILLGTGVLATWTLYLRLPQINDGASPSSVLPRSLRGLAGGAVIGFLAYLQLGPYLQGMDALDCVLFSGPLVSSLMVIFPALTTILRQKLEFSSISLPIILHTIAFLSNSFTFWEDRIVPFLLVSSITPSVLVGFTAPTARLQNRILGFSLVFAVCVRLMAISTICREEQQPYCHVTFFASSTLPSPPLLVLLLVIPTSIALPYVIKRFLGISKSDRGIATSFLPWVLSPALLAGTLYWMLEWAEAEGIIFGHEWTQLSRITRTTLARSAMAGIGIGGLALWWAVPLCLEIVMDSSKDKKPKKVTVIGFANAYGSPYLIFWTIFFSLLYTATQPTGQLILVLGVVALLSHLEVIDSVRDVQQLNVAFASSTPSTVLELKSTRQSISELKFSDVVPVALLGLHVFYGTGHQSTISSIQWKTAFLLTPTLVYPFSPLTVALNSFGPLLIFGLAVPLLMLWNRPPVPPSDIRADSARSGLAMMLYYASLLFGTAVSAAILRRHLMVWKVFAPRFMAAVAELLAVDLGVLIGVGLGVERIAVRVGKIFAGVDTSAVGSI